MHVGGTRQLALALPVYERELVFIAVSYTASLMHNHQANESNVAADCLVVRKWACLI